MLTVTPRVTLDAALWVCSSLENLSGGGDFSLGIHMGSDSFLPKTLSDESIN